jgi:hypothetical protein
MGFDIEPLRGKERQHATERNNRPTADSTPVSVSPPDVDDCHNAVRRALCIWASLEVRSAEVRNGRTRLDRALALELGRSPEDALADANSSRAELLSLRLRGSIREEGFGLQVVSSPISVMERCLSKRTRKVRSLQT